MLQRAHDQTISGEPFCLAASLFGSFKLQNINGEDIVITNRRARAILAILCLNPDEPIDRKLISKLLWPSRFPAHTRTSLRQCLLNLGKLLEASEADILDISRTQLRLKPESIQTDLMRLKRTLTEKGFVTASEQLMAIGSKPLQIYPGSPWEKGYNERFNGTLRHEVLNAEWFTSIK